MSTLGQAIAAKLQMPATEVGAVLAEHHVSSMALPAAAARLKLGRVRFEAVKTLTGVNADGTDADKNHTEKVPVEFLWDFGTGLHGIGSEKNLRGKSSVTRILLWALRGRCDLRDDVRKWMRRIELDFSIDDGEYRVAFDITDGAPRGTLERRREGAVTHVGSFASDNEFEETMGATMMRALSLPVIAATQDGRRTQHAWPTYAGALVVRGDSLDLLLGDTKFAGLPSRLLQMFVGSDWAAARAEATAAHSVSRADLTALEATISDRAKALSVAYENALQGVTHAEARLRALPTPTMAMADVDAALRALPPLDADVIAATALVTDAKIEHHRLTEQLKLAEFAANAATEDALAHRFFQQLRPTVCPRCSAPVTAARRKQEAKGHSCSVCVNELDLKAFSNEKIMSASASVLSAMTTTQEPDDDEEDVVDDIAALTAALHHAADRLAQRVADLETATAHRKAAAAVVAAASAQAPQTQARRDAELDLARAQGVAQALRPETAPSTPDQAELDRLREHVRVLRAAEKFTSEWVTTPQRDRLDALSARITELARSFGMGNLTGVVLDGGARMKVTTGGQETSYSKCERGEMLRLKLATAIALIEQARLSGIGRHPGLLFVDSPGSEEMDDDDFDTMLEALNQAATDSEIQVFVATRHVDSLLDLLPEERCRVGRGSNFVW